MPGFDDDLFEHKPIEEVGKPMIPTIPLIEELERTPEASGTQSDPINMESFMGGFAPPSPEQPNIAPSTEATTPQQAESTSETPVPAMKGGGIVNTYQVSYPVNNFYGGSVSNPISNFYGGGSVTLNPISNFYGGGSVIQTLIQTH